MTIKALFSTPSAEPYFKDIELPPPKDHEVTVQLLAVGYNHLAKSRAKGAHYTASKDETIVGIDGVGKVKGTGELVYFVSMEGTYAQELNVPKAAVYPLPANSSEEDVDRVIALANSAFASANAFSNRIGSLPENASVAVLGATGTSGRLAIQVAKNMFGAKTVIGIGRSQTKLDQLKKDEPLLDDVISLEESDEAIISGGKLSDIDVVFDLVWGNSASRVLNAAIKSKKVPHKRLVWVQTGQIGGEKADISPMALRSTNLVIVGSGFGPQPFSEIVKLIKVLVEKLADGTIGKGVPYKPLPFGTADERWNDELGDERVFFKF
ncbi:hypothetical protein JA9_004933 [Meyerozyma sp. JA9]|nr:hypothetical protein JA9_004933 [Meyerozyma sp. JA9]